MTSEQDYSREFFAWEEVSVCYPDMTLHEVNRAYYDRLVVDGLVVVGTFVRKILRLWEQDGKCYMQSIPMYPADQASVQTMDQRQTSFGWVTYLRVYAANYRQLSWTEVQAAVQDVYPGSWSFQMFPPKEETVDEENIYHLFMLDDAPTGVNIRRRDHAASDYVP